MLERAIADLEANEAAALKAFNDEKRTEIKEMGGRNSTKRSVEQTAVGPFCWSWEIPGHAKTLAPTPSGWDFSCADSIFGA